VAIEARYLGALVKHPDPLGIVAVVVNVPLGWEQDETDELDEPIPNESAEKQVSIVQCLENDLQSATEPFIDLGSDKRAESRRRPERGSVR